MAEEKKNPLIGAFRTPAPGIAPPTAALSGKPADEPDKSPADNKAAPTTTTAPIKSADEKKPAGPDKTTANSKAAQTNADTAPAKPADEKKPAEPDKIPADSKTAQTTGTVAPAKPADEKKPTEPGKTLADSKAAQTTGTTIPSKPADEKKPVEPGKAPADSKTAPTATAAPAKPADDKKPIEPGKTPADSKAAQTTVTPSKPADEKKSTEPGKPPADSKATPATGTTTLNKPAEDKKPTEPPKDDKAPAGERTAEGPKGSTVTKIFEDRLDAPDKAALFSLPVPGEGDVFSMALHPAYFRDFLDHPFSVNRETKDYKELFESIQNYGIREPVKCRPGRNGGVEIISGHRRHDIGMQLNYPIPTIIERIGEDDAQIQCVDGNLHRQDIPISELARAAQIKMEALKRKAGRRSKTEILAGPEPKKRSDELVGEDLGMSRASVQRLMRVNQLEAPLKKMVDKKELPLDTAEQISHMKPEEQKKLADAIEKEGGTIPSKTEAVKLKEESKAGTLTPEKIEKTVAPTKREESPQLKVTFNDEELRSYFPDKGTTVGEVKRTVFEALDLRQKALAREKAKAEKEKKPSFLTR